MLSVTIEKQQRLYTDIAKQAVEWSVRYMEHTVRRDIEDAVALGISLLDAIRRRHEHLVCRVESGVDPFEQEKYDAIMSAYRRWLSDSEYISDAVHAAGASQYYIAHADDFRRRYDAVLLLLSGNIQQRDFACGDLPAIVSSKASTPRGRGEIAPAMETYTGKIVRITDIAPADIVWEDIAHSLSLICRFTGHCRIRYSVAAHSLHCYYTAKKVLRLSRPLSICMLLHDAGEAFWNDLGTPHKYATNMSTYKGYLETAQRAVYRAARVYATAVNAGPIIHYIDNGILKEEARRLLKSKGDWKFCHSNDVKPIHIPTLRWWWFLFPGNAKRTFLKLISDWMQDVGRRARHTAGAAHVSV